MSRIGIPSVIQTTRGMPASIASNTASAAIFAGTKIILAFAPDALAASLTVLYTGTAREKVSSPLPVYNNPCLPGVTPATTLVPYLSI